ncbi:unnamed protein product [Bursaphelenchus xylophilus]|uniref:Bestrophin homolog n=1 Tax=Bursaphelenchus xylophilus TaxID=6326 RepID=A0A1I7RM66_BURXY|nr:unnamed protein product [Bursaphelenchus xylophilus]CAG9118243.1 unnamed protein product [Bursaphelenchus xylophilus]
MTVSYTLLVSGAQLESFVRLLIRWRGSVWKAVLPQLTVWTLAYMGISMVYRFAFDRDQQEIFEKVVRYFDKDLSKYLPLSFLLGFFVTQVVSRWSHITEDFGWIDNSATNFANFIHGTDEETRMCRRTLIRYMVLNQALVLRDISMQVRKRFPTYETMVAAGFMTDKEREELMSVHDEYTRYWMPLHWCYGILDKAKHDKRIDSDHILVYLVEDLQHFREGLTRLLKFDWIPIPLIYPQVVFLAVRMYFGICLVSRQHIKSDELDLWVPIMTMVEFFVYMGWMKVAEALLNPLGEDDDDLEINCVMDKNLITGMLLADRGANDVPSLTKDKHWNDHVIHPLYTYTAAGRTVQPLVGSAYEVNMVEDESKVHMVPHKSRLSHLGKDTYVSCSEVVDVTGHNKAHSEKVRSKRENNHDRAWKSIRDRRKVKPTNENSVILNGRDKTVVDLDNNTERSRF